jgi:hypothetical protein
MRRAVLVGIAWLIVLGLTVLLAYAGILAALKAIITR